jgi:anti-anti-sigma regulatory factor
MLKITTIPTAGRTTVLKIEGRLLEPWIGELLKALADARRSQGSPHLDLSEVNFVDAGGAKLLRDLAREGVEIVASSCFVRELLNTEKP